MDGRPVGVMDSGLGGVSVLRTLVHVLPDEHYIYLGDTRNAPYGDKSENEIRTLAMACAGMLMEKEIKALVVACNTATSAAVESLRSALSIPVIGMEPALKPAALSGRPGKILVMATSATLRQTKFQRLNRQYGENALMLPCPGLMEFAERGELDGPALSAYLDEQLVQIDRKAIGAVVLGCTHYVFLKKAIAAKFPDAQLFDGNLGTARRLESILRERDALNAGTGSVAFFSTMPDAVSAMQRLFFLPYDEESV